ncbi:MAG: ribosome maturation factor RimM [Amphiplicatus sp.]
MRESRVCLGAFAGAYGVKGAAKVKTFTEKPQNVAAYGPAASADGRRRFTLKVIRVLKSDLVLVSAPEIESREDAESLKGVKLYVPRAALPPPGEDEFYVEDLVGLRVLTEGRADAGEIAAVHNFGAGDLIEVKNAPGLKGGYLLAFTRKAFPRIDLEARTVTLADAARAAAGASLSDETGEIVSDDIAVNLDAMRAEDA